MYAHVDARTINLARYGAKVARHRYILLAAHVEIKFFEDCALDAFEEWSDRLRQADAGAWVGKHRCAPCANKELNTSQFLPKLLYRVLPQNPSSTGVCFSDRVYSTRYPMATFTSGLGREGSDGLLHIEAPGQGVRRVSIPDAASIHGLADSLTMRFLEGLPSRQAALQYVAKSLPADFSARLYRAIIEALAHR